MLWENPNLFPVPPVPKWFCLSGSIESTTLFHHEDRIILMRMQRHSRRRMLELWLRVGVKKETTFTTFWSVLSLEGGTKKRQV